MTGLQRDERETAAERTALAWERTSVAQLALAALIVRAGVAGGHLEIAIAIAAVLTLGAAAQWRFAVRRYRRNVARSQPMRARGIALAGLAALVAIAAAGSTVLVLDAR